MKTQSFLFLTLGWALTTSCATAPFKAPVTDGTDPVAQQSRAILSMEQPTRFQRQFPPPPEQRAAVQRSRGLIETPPTVDEVLQGLDPRERAQAQDSLREMLNPVRDTAPEN
jgi:ribosomal protein L30/L7E